VARRIVYLRGDRQIQPDSFLSTCLMPDSLLGSVVVVLYEPQPGEHRGDGARDEEHGRRPAAFVRPVGPMSSGRRHRASTMDVIEAIVISIRSTPPSPTAFAYSASPRRRAAKPSLTRRRARPNARRRNGLVALVFGREERVAERHPRSRARRGHVHDDYSSLNFAQAVLIGLYELQFAAADATRTIAATQDAPPPTNEQFSSSLAMPNVARAVEFFKTCLPEHIMRTLRSLTFRAAPNARERL
jgi:tRNA C32,U32 (ribose-2'-O)-methylase TrmJ